MKAAIFLDRDGTINRNCPYCRNPDEIEMYADVFKPIRELSGRYYMIIVTNQSGIARGYFTRKDLDAIHAKIKGEVSRHGGRIDAIYYCPHLPGEGCGCRKPNTGMIERAARDLRIDLANSFMVGDSDADVEMARRAGIISIRVRDKGRTKPDFFAKNFSGALGIIKSMEGKKTAGKVPKVGLILAGGEGTRMRPFTYRMPKPMARVRGKPIIEHIINEFTRNGIHDIFVSVGYKAGIIKKYLGNGSGLGAKIRYVSENEPLGTGGGTRLALKAILKEFGKTDVFVTNGDDIFSLSMAKMYAQHRRTKAIGTLALRKVGDVTGSGVVLLKGRRITGFVEKPDNASTPSHLVSLGKYIFSTEIMRLFPRKARFSLERDFMEKSAAKARLYGYRVEGRWYPINTVEALKRARKKLE